MEKLKKLEIENCKLETKLESANYKLKCSEEKNNEIISSLKGMNDMLLKKEKESNDILMKSIENLRKSKSAEITEGISNLSLNNKETFKSRYHPHTLNIKGQDIKLIVIFAEDTYIILKIIIVKDVDLIYVQIVKQ